jgi:hypothetical protein
MSNDESNLNDQYPMANDQSIFKAQILERPNASLARFGHFDFGAWSLIGNFSQKLF